jgi:hypothetical protein
MYDVAVAQPFAPRITELRPNEGVPTQFGGMLFLINLALHLGLYGDFTHPLDAGIGLSPWTLLALLGPHLLPTAANDDPIWALLADLAGAAPHAGFAAPRIWRVPRAWLAPFGTRAKLHLAHRAGWLQLVHPAGFVVLERRMSPVTRRQKAESRKQKPESRKRTAHCLLLTAHCLPISHPPDTLPGWIARLAGYAQARLALALGGADEVVRALALPARIYAGDVRVDVMFSLNELPIAVRLAGLDRDPGWVPAAGRGIRFHFG